MAKENNVVNIMHLSDIHCGEMNRPSYIRNRKDAIEAFHRDFCKIPDEWRPDIIVVTGDLGWSGNEEDYAEFKVFLEQLLKEARLTFENVICCPGNHDKCLPQDYKLSADIKGVSEYYSVESVWDNLTALTKKFECFSRKLKEIGIQPLCNKSQDELTKYLYGYRIIDGIYFMALNSAWLCDWRREKGADRGKLLIDADIVCELIDTDLPALPIIVMHHHPKEWLRESEICCSTGGPATVDRIHEVADIILNGHTHEPREYASREWLQYTAGTISSGDTYKFQCYLLKIHINADDPKLSYVEEGEYFSGWREQKIYWSFTNKPIVKYFDIMRLIEQKEGQLKSLTEECKKLKGIIESRNNERNELREALGKFIQWLAEEERECREILVQVKNMRENAQHMKLLRGKPERDQIYEETLSCCKKIERQIQELDNKFQRIIVLFYDVWQVVVEDMLDDAKSKEQSKQIIKALNSIRSSSETDEADI